MLDPSWKAKVHNTQLILSEKETILAHGIPKARRTELHGAFNLVLKARIVFQSCRPRYPKGHFHYVVVSLSKLVETLRTEFARQQLKLTEREMVFLIAQLDSHSLPPLQSIRRMTVLPAAKSFDEHFSQKHIDSDENLVFEQKSPPEPSDLSESVQGSKRPTEVKDMSTLSLLEAVSHKNH